MEMNSASKSKSVDPRYEDEPDADGLATLWKRFLEKEKAAGHLGFTHRWKRNGGVEIVIHFEAEEAFLTRLPEGWDYHTGIYGEGIFGIVGNCQDLPEAIKQCEDQLTAIAKKIIDRMETAEKELSEKYEKEWAEY